MAITQYQVFCRYINENTNRALTNNIALDWIGSEELSDVTKFYEENKNRYFTIRERMLKGELKKNELSVEELNIYDKCQKYENIQDKVIKNRMSIECCVLEPSDSLYNDSLGAKKRQKILRDSELYQKVADNAISTNPKYDMIFAYDGVSYVESRTGNADYNPPPNDAKQIPYAYYDKMKRIIADPWFLHSTHASLNSAMAKAKELVNIFGSNAVKIGKVVPLEHYIEIV